ncbi:MAG: sugar ABC transporter substrate-binding protein [Albidovulum sp.]|nr:sugar ABC transporter substrate-binding protein [Albidovulum sp.]MDE0306375.1 sugar ABC transporter substrate-binding protein [Albidovulum sp.]MDE0532185.1 sugar ABC transporter substrate-binding protein [Albidovulum sp.]
MKVMRFGSFFSKTGLAAVLAVGTAASPAISDEINISFVVKDMTNPYYWRMGEGAKKAAEDLGVNLSWMSAQFNGDIEGQIGVVEGELVKSPDALVLVPMNATALIPKIIEANGLGIPVITADTRAEEGLAQIETFVGLDERESFKGMAEYVVELLGGEGNIAILEGFRGSSTAELRLEGMMEVFNAAEGIEVVASISAEWDREKGLKATEDILQAHPDVDAIVGSNDQMALGAIQAVKSAGKLDDIIIVGDDAIPSALSALVNGELDATIDGNTDRVGYEAVVAAYNKVVNDADLDDWIVVPSSIMLKADVTQEYLDGRGITLE